MVRKKSNRHIDSHFHIVVLYQVPSASLQNTSYAMLDSKSRLLLFDSFYFANVEVYCGEGAALRVDSTVWLSLSSLDVIG